MGKCKIAPCLFCSASPTRHFRAVTYELRSAIRSKFYCPAKPKSCFSGRLGLRSWVVIGPCSLDSLGLFSVDSESASPLVGRQSVREKSHRVRGICGCFRMHPSCPYRRCVIAGIAVRENGEGVVADAFDTVLPPQFV